MCLLNEDKQGQDSQFPKVKINKTIHFLFERDEQNVRFPRFSSVEQSETDIFHCKFILVILLTVSILTIRAEVCLCLLFLAHGMMKENYKKKDWYEGGGVSYVWGKHSDRTGSSLSLPHTLPFLFCHNFWTSPFVRTYSYKYNHTTKNNRFWGPLFVFARKQCKDTGNVSVYPSAVQPQDWSPEWCDHANISLIPSVQKPHSNRQTTWMWMIKENGNKTTERRRKNLQRSLDIISSKLALQP